MYVSHLIYPFFCCWTFRWLACPGYFKWCCNHVFFFIYSFIWVYAPGMRLLGHIIVLFLFFEVTCMLFSIVAASIVHYIPINSVGGLSFLYILQHFFFADFLMMGILTGIRRYLFVSLTCNSLIISDIGYWASIHVFVSHLYVFFGEMSI